MLMDAVWMMVPMVTITHISCMNRMRPSLSPMKVCVRAPPASPAMYTATTWSVVSYGRFDGQKNATRRLLGGTYSSGQAMGGLVHIINPTLVGDSWGQGQPTGLIFRSQEMDHSLVVAIPVSNPCTQVSFNLISTETKDTYKQECADGGEERDAKRVPDRHDESSLTDQQCARHGLSKFKNDYDSPVV